MLEYDWWITTIFVLLFIFLMDFVLMNTFIAIIMVAYQQENKTLNSLKNDEEDIKKEHYVYSLPKLWK